MFYVASSSALIPVELSGLPAGIMSLPEGPNPSVHILNLRLFTAANKNGTDRGKKTGLGKLCTLDLTIGRRPIPNFFV